MRSPSGQRGLLVAVIALLLVTELALSPFYPQLLGKLYGAEDPGTVGLLLWLCRATALVALPLLGLLSRRLGLHRLVAAGLAACVVLDGALALAPSAAAFIALSAAAAAAGTALLLAYPALVALDDGGPPGVLAFVALLHGATLIATLLGAAITGLPNPRLGLGAIAALDLVLLVLVLRALPNAVAPAHAARTSRIVPPRQGAALAAVAVVAIAFELAANVVRPFFTAYAQESGLTLGAAALLFLLPSLAALGVLPMAAAVRCALGAALLPLALVTAALGAGLQAAVPDAAALIAGRLLLGVGLGLAHVELDLAMFAAAGTDGPGYAAVETLRAGALMLAPILAALTASASLASPLAAGALLFAVAAALTPVLITRPEMEEARARIP